MLTQSGLNHRPEGVSGKFKSSQVGPDKSQNDKQQVAENKMTSLKVSPQHITAFLNVFICVQNEQGQEIQLFVEGKDLVDLDFFSVSDPICVLRTKEALIEHATWQWNGETEVIDNNLNPKWIKHFNVWYNFVKDLDLHF